MRVAAIVLPFVNALALWILQFHVYMIVLAVLDVIAGYIAIRVFPEQHSRYYGIYFMKEDVSIPYEKLKDFMGHNNLK